jgi:ADP-dependent NAD(P)H-hydrate dehydratase / NAD(P)H-hydrate epimerase
VKIFSAAQIKKWDAYTIEHTPISSIDLMENAATACYNWLINHYNREKKFAVFCGTGNNGGDGLAIARLLINMGCHVQTYIISNNGEPGPDFSTNLQRLQAITTAVNFIQQEDELPVTEKGTVIIEAIFGTGINRPVAGLHAAVVKHINKTNCKVISIDMPAGLFADKSSIGNTIVKATHTLSFGCYKLAFLLAENEQFTGKVEVLIIGLCESFAEKEIAAFTITEKQDIRPLIKPWLQVAAVEKWERWF